MAIILPSGFNITNVDPVDARFSVADQSTRLGFSAANVYEGLVVYQQDTNELYVLINTGSYNSTAGWQLVGSNISTGSFAITGSNQFVGSQGITGSLFLIGSSSFVSTPSYQTNDFFLVRNSTTTLKVVTGGLQVSSSAQTPLQVFDQNNNSILNVSQSGVITFATQSAPPTGSANNGAIWITNTEFYVGLT
jgi:hypothetical protein